MPSKDRKHTSKREDSIVFLFLQDEDELESAIRRKQNEFLDLYSFYRETTLSWIKEELMQRAYELSLLDPDFTVEI